MIVPGVYGVAAIPMRDCATLDRSTSVGVDMLICVREALFFPGLSQRLSAPASEISKIFAGPHSVGSGVPLIPESGRAQRSAGHGVLVAIGLCSVTPFVPSSAVTGSLRRRFSLRSDQNQQIDPKPAARSVNSTELRSSESRSCHRDVAVSSLAATRSGSEIPVGRTTTAD